MAVDETVKVLDHGFVRFVESWGSDERIVESARMSVRAGFKGWGPVTCKRCEGTGRVPPKADSIDDGCPRCAATGAVPGDERLLDYLWRNRHSTPFEFAGLTIEVQAPIFVFRQWHRHRTQSYNEASARYAPLPEFDYLPTVDRLMIDADKSNRQAGRARGAERLARDAAAAWCALLAEHYRRAQDLYEAGLAAGIPKEVARLPLAVARYSKMRASANLLNWLRFERLRLDPHAQHEIRAFAQAVGSFLKREFPRTWALFEEGRGL